ncbi:MAG: outer membrane protein assembly factor BamA [Phycisphaerae bacterium]
MKKLLVLMFALSLFSVGLADERRIVELAVKGNVTLSSAEVLSKVAARPGQLYDIDRLTADTMRLGELDAVRYAYYNAEELDGGMRVTFVVLEKKLISSITFFGNSKLKDSVLLRAIDLSKGDYPDNIAVAEALDKIREKYSEKGYYFAKVDLDEDALADGSVIVRVEEGPRIKVGAVRFDGSSVFTERQLRKAVSLDSKVLFFIRRSYDKKKVEEDIEAIKALYLESGYMDVSCEAIPEFNSKMNRANIVYSISEGREYSINSINITGAEFYSAAELEEVVDEKEGDAYYSEAVQRTADKIRDKYREDGFIEATVKPVRKFTDSGDVNLSYEVNEGARYKIGLVEISGNFETHDKIIRRELDYAGFKPGRWFNAKDAPGTGNGLIENEIKRASLAGDVMITPVDSDEPDTKNALVTITEGMTGMLMFGAGVDSNNGLIGQVVIEQRNFDILDWPSSFGEFFSGKSFRGAGQSLRLSMEPGTDVSRYSLDFTEPYAWDRPLSFNLGSSRFYRGRESFDEVRDKAYFGLTRRYEDNWYLGMDFRIERVSVESIEAEAPAEVFDVAGDTTLFGSKFSITKRETDSRFLPTKGYRFDMSYEFVGGDYSFGIASSTLTNYRTLHEDIAGRKTVFTTKLHGAGIVGDAPLFEKFYAGGSGSLRGFDYRGVGPRGESSTTPGDFDDPIGSDWVLLAGSEVAIPLSSDRYNWLFFVDAGALDDNELRASIGTGIEILIPQWFGPVPMRFELAAPISKADNDETQVFSFSMGRLF